MDYKTAKTKYQVMALNENGEIDVEFIYGDFYEFYANNPIKYFKTYIYSKNICKYGFAFRVYGSEKWTKYQNRKGIFY